MFEYKDKYITRLVNAISIFVLLSLTIGFSAFQNNLLVSDIGTTIRKKADIRVTNIYSSGNTNDGASYWEDFNVHEISSSIELPNSNSSITYSVVITNIGNMEMGILNITGLPSNLKYTISNYNLKDALCDDNNSSKCSLGSVTTLNITISYNNGGYNSSNTEYQILMNFDFREVYNISYSGFSSVSGLPTKILNGESKSITFTSTTGIPYAVDVNNATGSYSSPTLNLSNATNNVVVTRKYSVTYVDFTGTTTGLVSSMTSSGGSITFDSTTSIPSSVTVAGATGSYTSPTLTITNVTGNITITAAYSGGGGGNGGTWEHPVEDTTTNVYDPVNDPPDEGTTVYTNVTGEPEVTVENGKVTRFEYTEPGNGFTTPSGGVNTGVLAFDGEDFTITLTAEYQVSNINGGSTYPVLDLSSSNPAEQTVDGFLILVALNYGGTNYNESDQSIGSTSSSKKYMKFRFNKYVDGGTGTSTGSQDYYSNAAGTAFYTYRFATLSTTLEVTIKIYCRNGQFTSDLLYNDVLKARPRYVSANNERKYTFDNPVTDTTIKLGYWKNKSGQEYTTNFTIKEFSVVKD